MAIFFYLHLFFILTILIPQVTPLNVTFNFTDMTNQEEKQLFLRKKHTYISDQGLQLTSNEATANTTMTAGRAVYYKPLHLWDHSTRYLADFNTTFTFVIDARGNLSRADGLTFFMASENFVFTAGGQLGLPANASTHNAIHPFVAVEFDTYSNYKLDPPYGDHVGIDVNSTVSVKAVKWWNDIEHGRENEARISYCSVSKNLSVVFTGFRNSSRVEWYGVSCIVGLTKVLPERVIFGFSASTGLGAEKNNVKLWSFSSTDLHGGWGKIKMGLSNGSCVLVGAMVFVGFSLWKKKRRDKKGKVDRDLDVFVMDSEFEMGTGPKKFSHGELARATNDFSEDEKLGEGGFGGVYRGFLKELRLYVAVKRISKRSKQGIKEYVSEVRIISRLRHKNLVQLVGWCHEKQELLLVYDLMENGSLDSHLFRENSLLVWKVRVSITRGLASALLYLHEEWEQCVLHRDIKSSNVMLDSNFNAKLGDFGLARLVDHEKESQTTVLAGTMGYMAPECIVSGKASKESDVYSFGIVALEIASGRRAIGFRAQESGNEMRLVEWVWELYGMGRVVEEMDQKLIGGDFDEKEVECLMIVGLWCAHPDIKFRPSIRQAIHVLNFEAPLPILPSMMPVPTYFAPPTCSFSDVFYGDLDLESK